LSESQQESVDLEKSDGSDSKDVVDVKGVAQKYMMDVPFIP
jgi:hypothetical protein